MTEPPLSIVGDWIVDEVRLTNRGRLPSNQLPASSVCFDASRCCYVDFIDSDILEEYEGSWIQEGDTILTSHGREWTYFPHSDRLSTDYDGEMTITFCRATQEALRHVRAAQFTTFKGIGQKTAGLLADEGLSLRDIRAWSDQSTEEWAQRLKLRPDVVVNFRDNVRQARTL